MSINAAAAAAAAAPPAAPAAMIATAAAPAAADWMSLLPSREILQKALQEHPPVHKTYLPYGTSGETGGTYVEEVPLDVRGSLKGPPLVCLMLLLLSVSSNTRTRNIRAKDKSSSSGI